MAFLSLQEAFSHVRPIPGDLTIWLASPSEKLLTTPVEALIERWEVRGLETQLVSAPHIRLRFDQRYLDWFWTTLAAAEGGLMATDSYLNRDLHPVGQFHGLAYWNAAFSPGVARVIALTSRMDLWVVSLPIIGCSLFFLAVAKLTGKREGIVVPFVVATTGFAGITADLLIIFAFQTLYGHVYQWIGLLIAVFMAGLSLGGLFMTRRLAGIERDKPVLLRLELAMVIYWVLLPIALSILYSRISHPLVYNSIQWILLLLNALAGFLVGSLFPLANRIWLRCRKLLGSTAGVLYAFDLVGTFLGSIVVSVFLFPVLGSLETCVVAAILKLGSLVLVATMLPRSWVRA